MKLQNQLGAALLSVALAFGAVAVSIAPHSAYAQENSATAGGLAGAVTDGTGAVVQGATVTIVGPQGTRVVKTDAAGRYTANGLVSGFYDITVEAPGFKKVVSKHVEVLVQRVETLDLKLEIGNIGESVEVSSGTVSIDPESTVINTNLSESFYSNLPVQRNVSALFYAAPGVVSGGGTGTSNPAIGGSSGLENIYTVDGVSITDQAFGALGTYNRNYGSLGTGVNLAFIRETQIKTAAFEPQYGKATGGVVTIVTKSGSNTYHGALAAYLRPSAFYASRYQWQQFGIQALSSNTLSSPQYEGSAEFGGYIPHFRDKLFFFGAFDPALNQNINLADPRAGLYSHGTYAYSTTSVNWAGKLTWQINANTTLEGSTFADPSRHNQTPITLAASNTYGYSSYHYGSRDSLARLNTSITPTWSAQAAYTYQHNNFTENPKYGNYYQISDRVVSGTPVVYGFGSIYPSVNNSYGIEVDTQKIQNMGKFGQHTFSLGYTYDHTSYIAGNAVRTGPLFALPTKNYQGTGLTSLPANFTGGMSNAQFRLFAVPSSLTCTICPVYRGKPVYLQVYRGTYGGIYANTAGRYHVVYGNDTIKASRRITLNLGLRWEQQLTQGSQVHYTFTDNWSPRLGITVDPYGDGKTKFFFNYAKYQWMLPLDGAIRQLGGELDATSYFFAPQADSAGNAVISAQGTVTPVLDQAHTLNGTGGFKQPGFGSSAGEGIFPGTKMEYETEYVLGLERQLKSNLVLKMRYADRQLSRIIEDFGSTSPEGYNAGCQNCGNSAIGNPGPGADYFINEKEYAYTVAQYNANPSAPISQCVGSDNGDSGLQYDSTGAPVGGACFTNFNEMDNYGKDGISDGMPKARRRYQAFELELNKNFTNHWYAMFNYRWSRLNGNFEGGYRNDNGQADPGLTSLFDFAPGQLNLLGDQFAPGKLNNNRASVLNLFTFYTVNAGTKYLSPMKGLTAGVGLRSQSGNPLNRLGGHPAYLNPGEVPIGGRGTAGTLPYTSQLDAHLDYPVSLGERYKLRLFFDAFNITNSQFMTNKNQNTDQGINNGKPIPNPDYLQPTAFQLPFNARISIKLEF